MNVPIPSSFVSFVESAISSGRYRDATEVVSEALSLLEKRDRVREQVRAGVEQLDRGEYTEYDEGSIDRFLGDVETEQRRLDGENAGG